MIVSPPPAAPKPSWRAERGEEIVPGRTVQSLLGGGERYEEPGE